MTPPKEILSPKVGTTTKNKTATPKTVDYSRKSDPVLRRLFYRHKILNHEIPAQLNATLAIRFPEYDPVAQKFNSKTQRRKRTTTRQERPHAPRDINWAKKSTTGLKNAYYYRINKNKPIEDGLNDALATIFGAKYDPVARRFKKVAPSQSGNYYLQSNNVTNAAEQSCEWNFDYQTPQLTVTLEPVVKESDTTFYNVYVNGEKILENHKNTKLKLFAGGTVLGIHGTVTDNQNLPKNPLWLVYKTNSGQMRWPGHSKCSSYDVYVQQINTSETNVNLKLSNESLIILEKEKLKRIAGNMRFKIER